MLDVADVHEDVETWRLGADRMLRGSKRDRRRHAYLLAAAALREAGEADLANRMEEAGLDENLTPLTYTRKRYSFWDMV